MWAAVVVARGWLVAYTSRCLFVAVPIFTVTMSTMSTMSTMLCILGIVCASLSLSLSLVLMLMLVILR